MNRLGDLKTLHYKQGLISPESWLNNMALVLISKGKLPVSTRGKTGTDAVAVRSNGQIGFSTSMAKAFEAVNHCAIQFDGETRLMAFFPIDPQKLPKGITLDSLFDVARSRGQKSNVEQRYISAANLLQHESVAYNYKVGTYSFPAVKTDKGVVSFTLPPSMPVKPKDETRKPKGSAKAAVAPNGAVAATPVASAPVPVVDDEPELLPAA